jgi:hypothetical protein
VSGEGVIFYNLSTKCLVRLAVAMHSLRKHYAGPATVLHVGTEGAEDACDLATKCGVDFKQISSRVSPGKNTALLGKTQLHLDTPYEISVLLDADTVTRRPFPELFEAARKHDFAAVRFADWKSNGAYYRKRIKQWSGIIPADWLKAALHFGPAINTGVFAFKRFAQLQHLLYEYAVQAREFFIPDEIAVCILAPQCKSIVMPAEFNASCKYGAPRSPETRIIHYHGNKHSRIEKGVCLNAADLWFREFEEVRDWPTVQRHIVDDRQLRKNLPRWDKVKGSVHGN